MARYGGEEFAVPLPETRAGNAESAAEVLRQAIADLALPHQLSDHGRIGIGLAGARCDARTSAAPILAAADGCLYVAKERGRNQVCSAAESPSLTLMG